MKIGFIGIGVMGTGIINNLRKNNYDVTVMGLNGRTIQLN